MSSERNCAYNGSTSCCSSTLDATITVCSVYIPPHLEANYFEDLLKQLPSPDILLGDFNGHNTLWGCSENNSRGTLIEVFITKNYICLMNDKSYTYIHPATGKSSSLDLSLCHPSLYLDFEWRVNDVQHGSDRFSVVIESIISSEEDHNTKWKLNKTNWELFISLCDEHLNIESFKESSDLVADFTSSFIKISESCIPKTSTNPKKSKPWYNNECKEAIKQRRQALSRFCRSPTGKISNEVKIFRTKALRTRRKAKVVEIIRFKT